MTRRNVRGAATAVPVMITRAPDVSGGPLMAQAAIQAHAAATANRAAPAVRAALLAETRQAAQADAGTEATPAAVAPAAITQNRSAAPVQTRTADQAAAGEAAARSEDGAAAASGGNTVTVTSATATPVDGGGFDVTMALELRAYGDSFGVAREAEAAIRAPGATRATVQEAILRAASARNAATVAGVAPAGSAARVTVCERETFRSRAIDSLLLRAGRTNAVSAQNQTAARDFRGLSFAELAGESLRAAGQSPAGLAPHQRIDRAMAVSDFPTILGQALNLSLENEVDEQPLSFTQFSVEVPLANLHPQTVASMGGYAAFRRTPEGSEVPFTSTNERFETWQPAVFSERVGFTFEALVNDRLSALTDQPRSIAEGWARTQTQEFYAQFSGNGRIMSDGNPLFHASHNNLLTASAGAPSKARLNALRQTMMLQTDANGRRINLMPSFILAPTPHLEAVEDVLAPLLAGMAVTIPDRIPKWIQNLRPIIEPELNQYSLAHWYAVANRAFQHGYLAENGGLELIDLPEGGVNGMFWKARGVFGAGPVGWTRIARQNGA
jgi:hypothetical protein